MLFDSETVYLFLLFSIAIWFFTEIFLLNEPKSKKRIIIIGVLSTIIIAISLFLEQKGIIDAEDFFGWAMMLSFFACPFLFIGGIIVATIGKENRKFALIMIIFSVIAFLLWQSECGNGR